MGLDLAQGITFVMPFYPDLNEEARAWTKRFTQRNGKAPSWGHIADYEGVLYYLQAVQKVGSDDARKVIPAMKATPLKSFSLDNAVIREDHQLVRPMYLTRVKSPSQSKGPGDYYDIIGKVAANDAFSPIAQSACGMVKK
jgi:branched-chain amino acid transport system substrate-binding protein